MRGLALNWGLGSSADALDAAATTTRRAESATLRMVYEGPDGGKRETERERNGKREMYWRALCAQLA